MHEVGLVMDLIERVNEIAKNETNVKVVAIDVCIGKKSGVDALAFDFAYKAAVIDTPFTETQLRIRTTEGFEFQFESLEVKDV